MYMSLTTSFCSTKTESDSLTNLQISQIFLLLLRAVMHNGELPHRFLRGRIFLLSLPHYLSFSDIRLHGDTLYPSISPFPPLVLRSLKVTSVWLPLTPGPVHFIAEPYIWTPLISLANPPPPPRPPALLHARLILDLSHPRLPSDTFTAEATDSDSHKLPLQQNQPILAD